MQSVDQNTSSVLRRIRDAGEALWFGSTFERRLRLFLLAIFVCGIGIAGVAYLKSRQSEYLLERTRLAHEVLASYLGLMLEVKNIHHLIDHMVTTDTPVIDADRTAVRQHTGAMLQTLKSLRTSIAVEIEFVRSTPDENEKEELERVAAIERRVVAFAQDTERLFVTSAKPTDVTHKRMQVTLDGHLGREAEELIKEGILDEQNEVRRGDELAKDLIVQSRRLTVFISAVALLITAVGWTFLVRNVRGPLAELGQAMAAFASGDLSRRVVIKTGIDEFAALGTFFNEMASEIETRSAAAADARSTLERTVVERSSSLEALNAQLEASDQSRRRFLADLSHELRTPLTIIRGESEIALRSTDSNLEEYRSSLTRILEQVKHTGALVDDLLFIARREVGEARIKLQPLDLKPLLQQVCGEMTPLCRKRGLTLNCAPSADVATVVLGDAARLKQVMLVLIDNSMRYSRPSGTINAQLMAATDGIVVIVRDDGIGVPADDLPYVFDRFYRGSNASAQTNEGVGLGLPIAKAIVEAHGGTISMESEADSGATVTIWLASAIRPGQSRLKAVS